MNWTDLVRIGATSCGGQIDLKNVNIGFITQDGPVLTPDGELLVRELLHGANGAEVVEVKTGVGLAPRGRKARVKAEATPVAEDGSDGDDQTTE